MVHDPQSTNPAPPDTDLELPGAQVLIAEDEPASLKLLARQLENAGYRVIPCIDGREALEKIQQQPVDLLIADWNMPEMDGVELCRNIRRLTLTGGLPFVYFILLTAESEQKKIVEGLEA
ncbi:MAG: response regulator, partial [Planctomycetota bacterium]